MINYIPRPPTSLLARKSLTGFLGTFLFLRILVYLIMSKIIPKSYIFLDGVHIHHFNEGIFMLALINGYMIFGDPKGRRIELVALLFGVAMALTFDEFGMWLNLNATYWQHMSLEMVFIIITVFGLIAYAPPKRELNFKKCALLFIMLLVYMVSARMGGVYLRAHYGAKLHHLFPQLI